MLTTDDLSADVIRHTRLLLIATCVVAVGVALPFVVGEAAWAFALLVAPLLWVSIGAVPVVSWTAVRAIVAARRGHDPRRWVVPFSASVLLVSLVFASVLVLRFWE
jgi:hypothetical protein